MCTFFKIIIPQSSPCNYNSDSTLQYMYDILCTCSDSSICPEMPRRNRIPFEHRERIVRAFEDANEDYLLVADTLGIKIHSQK